jgi:predicted phage terminase large subunit-like protein
VLGVKLQPFHKKWIDFVERNRFTVILAPRGSGKSTVLTVGYSLWRALLNRDLRVLIVSNTQRQTETFVREIRAHIESNSKVYDMFGNVKGNFWTPSELDFRGHRIQKEATITALGAQGSLIGRHMDMIILDDIVDAKNSATKLQRDKIWEWYFKTLMPMLEPTGEIHMIGTRWHEADFYSQIISTGSYKQKVDKALNGRKSYWPSQYSYETLKGYRRQNPEIFAMQYQNEIVQGKNAIFYDKDFRYYETLPVGLLFYQGVDLAASKTGDYFVICTIAKDVDVGNYYVVDVFRSRLSLSKQFEKIVQQGERFNPVKIGVEAGAYQTGMVEELKCDTTLPIRSIHQHTDKIARARRMSVLFENGQIYFPSRNMRLIDELRVFPKGEHDDCIDALEMALRISQRHEKWAWGDLKSRIFSGNYLRKV